MDGVTDWDLYAVVKGNCPTIEASSSSYAAAHPATTTTTRFIPATTAPTMHINSGQTLDGITDWNLDGMVDSFYPTIDAYSSSLAAILPTTTTTTTFIPTMTTTPTIPGNNKSQVSDEILDWNLDAMLNSLYPTVVASSSSFDIVNPTTTTTTPIPTIATDPTVHLNNNQMLDESIGWNLHAMVNGFCPTIASSSTVPITTTTITSTTIPMDIYNLQNSIFHGGRSNQFQTTNENNIIKQMMPISDNSLNFPNKHKAPLSSKNWPILSLPGFGKIPEPPNHQRQQQNQLQVRQESLHIFAGTSKSKKREMDGKRIYKMPPQGLKSDVWYWKKYGEKFVHGSSHPRIYYKCDSTSDCKAKRRVERNRYDPNSIILTYIGQHNHPMPMIMNYTINNSHNNPISSKDVLRVGTEYLEKKKNDDDIFEGLGSFVNL